MPCSLISWMSSKICWTRIGARPSDGSSSSSTLGRTSARGRWRASAARRRTAIRRAAEPLRRARETSSAPRSSSSARLRRGAREGAHLAGSRGRSGERRSAGPQATWAMPCLTSSCGAVCVMSLPSKMTVPFRGWSRPLIVFRVVVLPAPFEPSRVTISPCERQGRCPAVRGSCRSRCARRAARASALARSVLGVGCRRDSARRRSTRSGFDGVGGVAMSGDAVMLLALRGRPRSPWGWRAPPRACPRRSSRRGRGP